MVEKLQELLEQKKYAEIRKMLESSNSDDIPSIFDELDEEQIVVVYRLLSKDMAADVFVELDPDMQENLINAFSDKELKNVLDDIFMDDTVDLIEEMPASVVKRILRAQNSDDRKMINELLRYPEDSAGSIMTTEFVDLKENMTVEKAIEKIRNVGDDVESIYVCYVLTLTRQLIGIVSLKDLFGKIDDKNFDIRAVASTPYFLPENMSVYTAMERLRNENQRYGLVTDEFGSIEGIVTISDILGALVGSVSSGPSADIIIREDGSCLIDGQCSFYDFLDHYDMTDRYQEYNYNTLSGLILELLQHIPTEGEKIEWLCFTFEIVDMDGARIDKVLVQKNETDNITL